MSDWLTTRDLWGDYIRELANLIGLRDWCLHLMEDPTKDGDALAEIHPTYGRKHAQLYLCKDWEELAPETQRAVALHELLHAQRAGADSYVQNTVDRFVAQREYLVWFEGYRQHVEYTVDGLTDHIAPLLPLPPEGTKHGDKAPPPPIPSGAWAGEET